MSTSETTPLDKVGVVNYRLAGWDGHKLLTPSTAMWFDDVPAAREWAADQEPPMRVGELDLVVNGERVGDVADLVELGEGTPDDQALTALRDRARDRKARDLQARITRVDGALSSILRTVSSLEDFPLRDLARHVDAFERAAVLLRRALNTLDPKAGE